MHVETSRFGRITVEEKDIVTFPEGIIGFSECKRYVLLAKEGERPFQWLQSLDDGDLAFVVIDPVMIEPNYTVEVGAEEIKPLQLSDVKEARVLTIVVIPPENFKHARTNLRGPIVINPRNNTARQLVLSDEYPIRRPLFQEGSSDACTQAQAR